MTVGRADRMFSPEKTLVCAPSGAVRPAAAAAPLDSAVGRADRKPLRPNAVGTPSGASQHPVGALTAGNWRHGAALDPVSNEPGGSPTGTTPGSLTEGV